MRKLAMLLLLAVVGLWAARPRAVALTWTASTSSGVVGYNLYRAAGATGTFSRINSSLISGTSYTDTAVAGGATYFYRATAVDSAGSESAYSNTAQAVMSAATKRGRSSKGKMK